MKTALVLSLLFAASPVPEPVKKAQGLWAEEKYNDGRQVLIAASEDASLHPATRAAVLASLAEFDEDSVGSHSMAEKSYKKILALGLEEDSPSVVQAKKQITRIGGYRSAFAKQDAILDNARSLTEDREEILARIADLGKIVDETPDYPRMAKVHHFIGVNAMWINRWADAVEAFDTAIALRPAIGLIHPSPQYRKTARKQWLLAVVPLSAWTATGVLGVICIASFMLGRGWRRVGRRRLVILVIIAAAWVGSVGIACLFVPETPDHKIESNFTPPVEIHRGLFMEGAENLLPLVWFGLLGIVGTFLFALGTAAIRRMFLRIIANLLFAVLLLGNLTTIYYMKHCFDASLKSGDGVSSSIIFHVKDITAPIPEPDE